MVVVALLFFSSVYDSLLELVSQKLKEEKYSENLPRLQKCEHVLFMGPLRRNLFGCVGVCTLWDGLVERAWPRSFREFIGLAGRKGCSHSLASEEFRRAVVVVFALGIVGRRNPNMCRLNVR